MKPVAAPLSALLIAVACGSADKPVNVQPTAPAASTDPAIPEYTAEQFYETTTVSGSSFSHDETRILVTSDETGVANVYAQPVAGGTRTPLTQSTTESLYAVSYFPSDDRFLYTADSGGNEQTHLFVMQADGTPRDLTPGDKTKASFRGWSGHKKSFWVLSNERDPRQFDLYRYSATDYERTRVFKNSQGWSVNSVSRDERWVALTKVKNNVESNVYLWDAARPRRAPILVTKHKGNAIHSALGFTPDSRRLLYSTDAHGEFFQIWSFDVVSKEHTLHTEADWDVLYAEYSETGKYQVTGINADARTQLKVTEVATGTPITLPELPAGDLTAVRFSPSETRMTFAVSRDRASTDLFVLDLATNQLKQLTQTMNPAIRSDHLVDGEIIRFKSFDGLDIPAILYRPKRATATRKVPAMLWIHGGPGGQSRLGYQPMIQHLVNHGYAIFAVNNRGSSGYGKTFFHADDRKHGDVDLKDCVWGRKYLETLDWIDGEQIGIMGGSYGGYMVLAALAFTPEAFNVGIDIFGVSNWLRTLESIPPWWEPFAEALYAELGHPKRDRESLHARSPLFHAANIRRPLLVIQGANDPRVLKVESDEIVAAVRKNNVPVNYVLFADEGHGFRKRENRIAASSAFLKFLDSHLRESRAKQ